MIELLIFIKKFNKNITSKNNSHKISNKSGDIINISTSFL